MGRALDDTVNYPPSDPLSLLLRDSATEGSRYSDSSSGNQWLQLRLFAKPSSAQTRIYVITHIPCMYHPLLPRISYYGG